MTQLIPPVGATLLALVSIVVGVALPVGGRLTPTLRSLAVLPLIAGIAVVRAALAEITAHQTTINTFGEPTFLVTTGPYARSRNPMYLGMTLVLGAVAVAVGSPVALVGPAGFVALSRIWYIPTEERSLRKQFPITYDEYASRVPRWFGLRQWTR